MQNSLKFEDRSKKLAKRIEKQLIDFTNQDEFKRYLHFMASMRNYSLENQLLIFSQNPRASYVAGFSAWKKLNRYVNKGEKAIFIKAPIFTEKSIIDKEPNKSISEKTKAERVLMGYKFVSVFDISQTSGEELRLPRDFVKENFETSEQATIIYERLTRFLQEKTNVKVYEERYSIEERGRGFYAPATHEIVINSSETSGVAKLKTLIHEFAHAELHNYQSDMNGLPRGHKEAQAESVAYAVMAHLGFDTSNYSLGYIATWARDIEMMRAALTEIRATLEKTLNIVDTVLNPKLSLELESKANMKNKMNQKELRITISTLEKHLPSLFLTVSNKDINIEIFDTRVGQFQIVNYHKEKGMLNDERGGIIRNDMLDKKSVLLLNVIDSNDQVLEHYKSFPKQFSLRQDNGNAEVYHVKTNTTIADFKELPAAKKGFIQMAVEQNCNLKSFIGGKGEFKHFKKLLSEEEKKISLVQTEGKTHKISSNEIMEQPDIQKSKSREVEMKNTMV